MKTTSIASALVLAWSACGTAALADTGKLVLTGGVSSIDGAAGGGLTPWAVIGSNATEGEIGASAHISRLSTQDYGLTTYGATVGLYDRVELSLARQDFDASPTLALNGIAPFGVAPGEHLRMDIAGVKVRLAGDAILESDSLLPQVSVGLLHKRVQPGSLGSVLDFLGTRRSGTDFYVSATKLFLGQGLLLNATLRNTNANQNGLLGFGTASPGRDSRRWQPELSAALLLRRNLAIGAEYRHKPNNLEALGRAAGLGGALREDSWKDIFVAWAPSKHLSLTLAYVQLGRVVPGITSGRDQSGAYLSAQAAF
ncbi:DUF3034 family protein [Ramlibacter tataouinensis]|uniref:DUF3034 domain-containing protein n=1 Tax=Ramlibacter tataouinensis (strain ATCC BAA-407 / DSM 14655 / LMG 21543 / TTB310) TaxID=365046 RepID=F5Y5W1_RAMTT|nr:DUF3034 family protein [Ramlibacter tataouinensis]AEG93995.1 conserved hypothetical protein [Ramlibacter tataouinensis TTB310]